MRLGWWWRYTVRSFLCPVVLVALPQFLLKSSEDLIPKFLLGQVINELVHCGRNPDPKFIIFLYDACNHLIQLLLGFCRLPSGCITFSFFNLWFYFLFFQVTFIFGQTFSDECLK